MRFEDYAALLGVPVVFAILFVCFAIFSHYCNRMGKQLDKIVSLAMLDVNGKSAKNDLAICPYCGHEIKRDEKKCPECGKPVVKVLCMSFAEFTEEDAFLYMYFIGRSIFNLTFFSSLFPPTEEIVRQLRTFPFHISTYKRFISIIMTRKTKMYGHFFTSNDKALFIYIKFRLVQFAQALTLERVNGQHQLIVCDACGGLIDIDHNSTCPHCGHHYENDIKFYNIMNVLVTDDNIYMDVDSQTVLVSEIQLLFHNWHDNLKKNMFEDNVPAVYPPGYKEISQYILEDKEEKNKNG